MLVVIPAQITTTKLSLLVVTCEVCLTSTGSIDAFARQIPSICQQPLDVMISIIKLFQAKLIVGNVFNTVKDDFLEPFYPGARRAF